MRFFKEYLMGIIRGWNWFWFDSVSESSPLVLGVFRFFFYLVMFYFYLSRAPDVAFFYSEQGIFPDSYRAGMEYFKYHPTIFGANTSITTLNLVHSLFLGTLFFAALGLFSRTMVIAAFFLHCMFLNRNLTVIFGVDMIGTFFMLYMCFTNSGARFSLDALIFRRRSPGELGLFSHLAMRLMQLQLCVVYSYAGLEKMKGTRWWDGSAMWDVSSISNMQRWDLSFISHMPVLLSISVYAVLFWEVYFCVLVWLPRFRIPVLIFGVALHLGIYLFMNLPTFAFMMMAYYILFLKEDEVRFVFERVTRVFDRRPIPSRS